MKKIAIIGAGPAGMMASIMAAKSGNDVSLIDSNAQVGRKLLVTGAGRCNLTNAHVSAEKYACENIRWLETVLGHYTRTQLLDFLDSIGVPSYATDDGWYYPLSESAHAVADAFEAALLRSRVKLLLKKKVTGIDRNDNQFEVMLHREALRVDRIICASGGKAYPTLGSDGSLVSVIQNLGHKINPLLPALAPVTADMRSFQDIQGVRLDAEVKLIQHGKQLASTVGNIIFTQWGINGPGVMDISHHISMNTSKDMFLEIDLLHRFSDKIHALLLDEKNKEMPVRVALQSVLPPKMAVFIAKSSGIDHSSKLGSLSKPDLEGLFRNATRLKLTVSGTRGFDYCQVSTGGVPLEEVNPVTLESLVLPDLFLAGEILDVTGPCGGFNLHFAFTTGALAGLSAGK